ncbi:unnamed protein product [Macrosiphum euphorbiae]|uniref:DUF4806 domain-containing protein n=1 Tax=Macrosiphum euphorbiae TaxID=13131 RepID=A0AAV0Y9L5_9HEMI|nr:unnamed protein product [Macrosiphum euphorbiae]
MWSIIEFVDEKTVEAVPNYWFKNQKCAWPKKNIKKMIQNRVYPNVLDFNFHAARKIGKDIESYSIASQKAMKALYTSDLSTNESSSQINEFENTCTNNKTKRKIILKGKKTENPLLWSPASCDLSNDEIDDSDADPNYSPRHIENISHETPTKIIAAEEINISNSCPVTSLNVKKRLAFDIPERHCSLSPSVFSGVKKLKNIGPDTRVISSNKLVGHKSSEIVHTTSSPFKVTLNQSIEESSDINTSSAVNNSVLDYLQKMNRTICNIKYDLNMMADKINNIEGMLFNDFKSGDQSKRNCDHTFQTEFNNLLPLETEENLQTFEIKLFNKEFRAKMVEEIKRYSRNTLPSTVRAIMRIIFQDRLLEEYSYKGIGNKKVFYTLATCSIIFEAIKKMKKFSKFDAKDVENPLKIFIAGAKFRDSTRKNNQNQEADLLDNASASANT